MKKETQPPYTLKKWEKPVLIELNIQDTKTGIFGTITDGTNTTATAS